MLSMETAQTESLNLEIMEEKVIEEDGEILEDGEIDEEDAKEEDTKEDEEEVSEEEEKKKHHKRSHHKRKKKRDKYEDKKSKHKKRKGDDGNDGGDSPSKKKKRRKKHSRKDRSSSSPDIEASYDYQTSHKESVSPILPSDKDTYSTYDQYGSGAYTETDYSVYEPYATPKTIDPCTQSNVMDAFGSYDTSDYQQQQQNQPQEEYSSGSDSYYSDFESHLAQYKSYKKNSLTEKNSKTNFNENGNNPDNDTNYNNSQRQRRSTDSSSNRHDRRNSHKSSPYERRRPTSTRSRRLKEEERKQKDDGKSKNDKYTSLRSSRNRFENNSSCTKARKNVELCQYYLAGHCHHGNNCTYMHVVATQDYPCKYFHTGDCYSEGACRFSHSPPNETTKDIIEKMKESVTAGDKKEREELEKAGIKPLQKPPPGHGLLPTPPVPLSGIAPANQEGVLSSNGGSLKSLMDLDVNPTSEFQKKIDSGEIENSPRKIWNPLNLPTMPFHMFFRSIPSITMTDDELESHQVAVGMNNPIFNQPPPPVNLLSLSQGNGLLPTPMPPIMPPFPPPGVPNASMMISTPQMQAAARMTAITGGVTPPWIQRQQVMLQQSNTKGFYENFYGNKTNSVGLLPTPNVEKDKEIGDIENNRKPLVKSPSKDDPEILDNGDVEEDLIKEEEDIIRCHNDVIHADYGVIKDNSLMAASENHTSIKAPDFLPAKQKALFMRINQKSTLSNDGKSDDGHNNGRGNSTENWVYSSDEDDSQLTQTKSKSSSQSIIEMMSDKTKSNSTVDTNLLSKVADVINLPTLSVTQSSDHDNSKMMSPARQPSYHCDRKNSTSSDASPGHPSIKSPAHGHHNTIRRKLSSSELNKEPTTIPLVAKQNVDSVHSTHPDPRITLSRLLGQKKMNFKGQLPPFSKNIVMNGSSKLLGLKITLSAKGGNAKPDTSKKTDPRLARQALLNDPRVKIKPNDPRLRGRSSSINNNNTSVPNSTPKISTIPEKPSALLVKPPSISAIPSLPELNLDLAKLVDNTKTSSVTPPIPKPILHNEFTSLPILHKASLNLASYNQNSGIVKSPKIENITLRSSSTIVAPYDPRFITSGASTTTTASSAPYDPRLSNINKPSTKTINTDSSTASSCPSKMPTPVLFDPRNSPDLTKTMPTLSKALPSLPKLTPAPPRLTPAPGYVIKKVVQQNNVILPAGNQTNF